MPPLPPQRIKNIENGNGNDTRGNILQTANEMHNSITCASLYYDVAVRQINPEINIIQWNRNGKNVNNRLCPV